MKVPAQCERDKYTGATCEEFDPDDQETWCRPCLISAIRKAEKAPEKTLGQAVAEAHLDNLRWLASRGNDA